MSENGTKQAKDTYEKISAITTDATDLSKNSYSTAIESVHDYNKLFEFANANIDTTFDFVQKLSGVNSPSAFILLSTEYARKQFETVTEQTKQLTELAQKVTRATAEPLKTGVAKAFNHAGLS
jgi:phasin